MNTNSQQLTNNLLNRSAFLSLLVVISLIFLNLSSISSYACSTQEIIIDSVNIGDIFDESDHNLFGWGPIEPATHGGNWGGADDGNLRVVWYNDTANPSDVPTQSPDENLASVQLNIPANYIPTKIHIRALDGIADDSFEVYINNIMIYSYNDTGSIETWKTHEIDVSSIDLQGVIELKIKSNSPSWNSFDTYGQLGISWINLYGIEGQKVTVKLVDSADNPLENGYVEYYTNGWKEFGITDVTGNANKLLPKGKYTFRMTYLDASVSKKQDVGVDSLVVFSTVLVTVRFENSSGFPISEGNISFHSGGWKFFGVTNENGEAKKELLPRTYTFRVAYDGSSVSLKQDVGVDSLVVFSTVEVFVVLQDSIGNFLVGGNVSYYSGGWKFFGVTDVNGSVSGELLPKVYTFRMTYLDASVSKKQDVASDSIVVFSTVNTTVGLFDSMGNPLSNNFVEFHSGGWKPFGITNLSGEVKKELLARTYTFRVKYDDASISKKQDVSIDTYVMFNTINVTIKLQDSNLFDLEGGDIYYYSSGWKYLGTTDNTGSVYAELLPIKYTFKVVYDGASVSKKQDVASDSLVVFSTVLVTVRFENSSGFPISEGNVSYYSGSWKFFGLTDANGEVKKELLAVTYTFRMKYDDASVSKKQDVASDSLVIFSTVLVNVRFENSSGFPISDGNVSYYSGSWKFFGVTDVNGSVSGELLPAVYTFRMTYLDASVSKKQDVISDSIVVFSTVNTTVGLFDSIGHPLSNIFVEFHSGGWKTFGITNISGEVKKELLPKTYTFRVTYDESSVSLKQDVGVDSLVVFSTVEVFVVLQDSIGNFLAGGNVSYYSGSWKFFGVTNENGEAKKELLPRTYTFKALYCAKRYTTKQNVGENHIVIIQTNTIEFYPPVAVSSGLYYGYLNESVQFNGSLSYDPDGYIVNYTWDFGDGNKSYEQSPEHIYSKVGEYIVNLSVVDDYGLTNYNITSVKITVNSSDNQNSEESVQNTVTDNKNKYTSLQNQNVEELPSLDLEEIEQTNDEKINVIPVAKLVFQIKEDEENVILFDASGSYDPEGDELYYRWDFDNDGIWDTDYSKEPISLYRFSKENIESITSHARVEVFDGLNTNDVTISYIIPGYATELKEIGNSEVSFHQEIRYLVIEWWFIFINIIFSCVIVLYIFKKRYLILEKFESKFLITKDKKEKIPKIVSLILKLFYI